MRFDAERAARYDRHVRRLVPGYDALHLLAAALLRDRLASASRILVVGAGTGEELVRLAACDATWRFTAVEPSPPMAERLRARVAEHGCAGRVLVHEGYLHELPGGLPPHDAAALLLVLHFLRDDGAKAALLAEVAARVAPGAPLVHADMHGAPGSDGFALLLGAWKTSFVLDGSDRAEVEAGFARLLDDVAFVPEARLAELWTAAGFVRPVRFFASHVVGAWMLERGRGPEGAQGRS